MARPKKIGMSYFPLDCQMDDKIEMLEAEHDLPGFAVYIKLLQAIYQTEEGELDMSIVFRWKTLGKTYGIPPENLQNMVNTMLSVGLFCKKCFDDRQVLTSNGIKKRIGQVSELRFKERKRKEKPDLDSFPAGKPKENPRKSAQKEKEKEKEKEKPNNGASASELTDFEKFEIIRNEYPGTTRGPKTEWEDFKKKFSKEITTEFLRKIWLGLEAKRKTHKRLAAAGQFVPEWPHFKTYLNQRRWEEETPEKPASEPVKEVSAFNSLEEHYDYWGGAPAKPTAA